MIHYLSIKLSGKSILSNKDKIFPIKCFPFYLLFIYYQSIKEHTIKLNPKLFNALISNKPLPSLLPPKKKKTNKQSELLYYHIYHLSLYIWKWGSILERFASKFLKSVINYSDCFKISKAWDSSLIE